MQNRLINTEPKPLKYYKDILIHADLGVHERAAELAQKYFPPNCSVLDVGAGAGAFSQRLADIGYNVTALDVDPLKWIPKDIPFLELDIDAGVQASVNQQFDSVVCLEVIEHVKNSWNLLNELFNVTRPGGYLLLSTPNVTSFLSRAEFFVTGRFHQFDYTDLSYGHINPISAFHLQNHAESVGWKLIDIQPGGYLPVLNLTTFRPFLWVAAMNTLSALSYLISRGHKQGWTLFYVMQKAKSSTR
jgi:2-polyprenyl-3-methyl-5-hydroxy-6-metoxy-1,4-benzoquinol methylase